MRKLGNRSDPVGNRVDFIFIGGGSIEADPELDAYTDLCMVSEQDFDAWEDARLSWEGRDGTDKDRQEDHGWDDGITEGMACSHCSS